MWRMVIFAIILSCICHKTRADRLSSEFKDRSDATAECYITQSDHKLTKCSVNHTVATLDRTNDIIQVVTLRYDIINPHSNTCY